MKGDTSKDYKNQIDKLKKELKDQEEAASYTDSPKNLMAAKLKIAELEKQVQRPKDTTYSTTDLIKNYAILTSTQALELTKWMAGTQDLAEQLIEADRNYKELKVEKTDSESTLGTAYADLDRIISQLIESKNLLEQTKANHTQELENLSKIHQEALNQQEQRHDRIVDDLTDNLNQVQDENFAKTVELGKLNKDCKSLKEQKERVEIKLKTTIQQIKTSEEVLILEGARMKKLKRKLEEPIDSIRFTN